MGNELKHALLHEVTHGAEKAFDPTPYARYDLRFCAFQPLARIADDLCSDRHVFDLDAFSYFPILELLCGRKACSKSPPIFWRVPPCASPQNISVWRTR